MANSRKTMAMRMIMAGTALMALTACEKPLDFDLRGMADGFSTAPAAQEARTAARPAPDATGVISYPNYQVAVARRGDTISSVAARVGLPAAELARYNGITTDAPLRAGETIALPKRVGETSAQPISSGTIASGERIDVTTLANDAIDKAERTTTTKPATTPPAAHGQTEPVRHQVQRGETAYSIARRYGISVRALADWNGLSPNLSIAEGRYLLIPVKTHDSASVPATAAPADPNAASPKPGQGSVTPIPPSAATPLPEPEATTKASPTKQPAVDLGATQTASSTAEMSKPVSGAIIRDYDKTKSKFILFSAPSGTPVKAAKDGTVKLISTNADGVKIMVIDHGGGLQTAYSFIDGISVKKGDAVKRDQTIAKVTANEFNALQFMVFKGTQTVDPTPYLN